MHVDREMHSERIKVLRCQVGGEDKLLPAITVVRISLRLPTVRGSLGPTVEFDGQAWALCDTRSRQSLSVRDHFVFVRRGDRRTVMVVDRVLDIEELEEPQPDAFLWMDPEPRDE